MNSRGSIRSFIGIASAMCVVIATATPSAHAKPAGDYLKSRADSVELADKRTQHSKTFRNPDGTRTWSCSQASVHFQDGLGAWNDIDTEIKPLASGPYAYGMTRNAYQTFFADSASAPALAEFRAGDWAVSFTPANVRIGEIVTRDNTITYKGALPGGADLRFTTAADEMREEIILHSKSKGNVWEIEMHLKGVRMEEGKSGTLDFVDVKTGRRIWFMPKPFMFDASGEFSEAVSKKLVRRDGKVFLRVDADADWLRSTNRVYPVVVDPTWSKTSPTADTYVRQNAATTSYGTIAYLAVRAKSGEDWTGYAKWDMTGAPSQSQMDDTASSAKVIVTMARAFTDGTTTVRTHKVTSSWSESTNWNTRPSHHGTSWDGAKTWTITQGETITHQWNGRTHTAGIPDSNGVAFVGYSANRASAYSREGTTPPKLELTYTACTPPAAPSNPGATNITTSGIRWTWTDNSSDETGFKVYAGAGAEAPTSDPITTDEDVTFYDYGGSLGANTQHAFQVSATNGSCDSAKTTNLAKYTLSAPPVSGSVTPSPSSPNATIPFTWTNNLGFGSGGVAKFKYVFDTNASHTWDETESEWTSGTLSTTATTAGTWYLHVKGYNGDGIANGTYDYPITVGDVPAWGIQNGGFEQGNTGGVGNYWTSYLESGATGAFTIQTASPPEGAQYQQVQITTANKYGGVYQTVADHDIGRIYQLTGSYRTNSTSATVKVRIDTNGGTDPAAAEFVNAGTTGTSWTTFSEVFCATGTSVTYFLHSAVTTVDKAGAFDNIVLVPGPMNKVPYAQSAVVCSGSGTNIVVPDSEVGTTYQLQSSDGTNVGSPVAGDGSDLSLPTGNLTSQTTFKVLATQSIASYMYEDYSSQPLAVKLVTVTVTQPPTATAGPDQAIYEGGTTAGLGGNTPTSPATGAWSVVTEGFTGTFSPDNTTPNATWTQSSGIGACTLRWTVHNPPCADASDDVVVTVSATPSHCVVNGEMDQWPDPATVASSWLTNGTTGTFARETTIARGVNSKSQKITAPSVSPYTSSTMYQVVSVAPDRGYVFKLWIYRQMGDTKPAYAMVGVNPDGGSAPSLGGTLGTGDTWVERVEPFTSGSSGLAAIGFAAVRDGGVYNVYFDSVTIEPQKPTTTGGGGTICSGGSATLTASGGFGGADSELHWYAGPGGTGGEVGTGTSLVVNNITSTTTYYPRWEDSAHSGDCRYSEDGAAVTVTVMSGPTAPDSASASPSAICAGESTTLTASGGSGDTCKWYAGSCGGTLVDTGTSIVVSPSATTTYYVRWENTCGASSCADVTVTVNQPPSAPTSPGATADSTSQITWSWTKDAGAADYKFYTQSSGGTGTSLGDVASYPEGSLSANTQYQRWVSSVSSEGCESSSRLELPATYTLANTPDAPAVGNPTSSTLDVNPASITPAATELAITIGGGAYTLAVDWVQADGTVASSPVWQTDAAWDTKTVTGLAGGTEYTFQVMARNGDNVVTSLSAGSTGTTTTSCVAVEITADPSGQSVCAGGTATFSVSVTGDTPIDYQWQKWDSTAEEWVDLVDEEDHISGADTDTLQVDNAGSSDAGDYRCHVTNCSGANSDDSEAATLTVTQPPTAASAGASQTICALGTTSGLGGNTPSVGTGQWSVVSGGEGTFSPDALTPNATFTHTSGAGPIVLRWTISNPPCGASYADVEVTISQPPTTASAGENQAICAGGTTSGLGGNTPSVGTGLWTIESGGAGSFSPNASTPDAVFVHASGDGPVVLRWTISNPPCSDSYDEVSVTIYALPSVPTNPQASPAAICAGGSSTLSAAVGEGEEVEWFSGSCGGTAVTSPVSPTETTTYYARAKNSTTGCVSATCAEVTVTVNPLPSAPTNPQASPATICAGGSSTLSATVGEGEEVDWFTGSCGGTAVTSPVSPTETTTYYARARNSTTGCVSATCAEVTVTVNPVPGAPVASAASGIGATTITWNWEAVDGASGYRLWTEATEGTQIGGTITDPNYPETGLDPGTTYTRYVEAFSSAGCTSSRTQLTAATNVRYCLENADFEETVPYTVADSWTSIVTIPNGGTPIFASAVGNNGNGQKITWTKASQEAFVYQKFSAKAGAVYRLGVNAISTHTASRAQLRYDITGGNTPAGISNLAADGSGQTIWHELSGNTLARETDGVITVFVGAYGTSNGSGQSTTFDDVSIRPANPTSAQASESGYCSDSIPSTIDLSVTGGYGIMSAVRWYTDAACTTPLMQGESPVTGSPATITAPTTTTTYYGRYEGDCSNSAAASVTVNVLTPPNTGTGVTPSTKTICSGTAVEVTVVSAESGVTYQLYDGSSPSGSPGVGTGADLVLTSAALTASTTLSVQASRSPCASVFLTQTVAVTVDSAAPTVLDVSSDTDDGAYGVGDTIDVRVTFSEPVTVGDTETKPRIKLATGTVEQYAAYDQMDTDPAVVHFKYTVQAGDQSTDLDYTGTDALEINDGSISDACGNAAVLTLPAPGGAGSLGYYKAIVVNGNQVSGTISMSTLSTAEYVFERDIVFVATDSTGNELASWTVTVAFTNLAGEASGTYSLTQVPADIAGLSAKSAWSLRQKLAPVALVNGQVTADFDLLGGDLNDSNSINILDYVVLKTRWYTTDPVADINADGTVEANDYTIMKSNWFGTGDPK